MATKLTLTLASTVLAIVVSGCSTTGQISLFDKNNKEYKGTYNSWDKSMQVNINGKDYTGTYLTNSKVSVVSTQGYSKNKYVYGTGTAVTGGSAGRVLLRAVDGSLIQCEFSYDSSQAIGSCNDASGNLYHFTAANDVD